MRSTLPAFILVAILPAAPLPAQAAPAMVAEGVLSTPDDELNSAFTPDGRTVYFSRNFGDRFGVILVSHMANGKWSPPEVAPFSGQFSDYDPFVSPDGARLYWISTRPVDGKAREDYDIWMVERSGNGWGTPVHLDAPINTEAQEFYPTVSASGTLYFSSSRPGGKGRGGDIYRAVREGDRFGAPESLGDSVNAAVHDADPYIAPDESYIVFASYGREGGIGGGDLYVSHRRDGVWGSARHIGNGVNSAAREYCPIVSPDGKWLYFTSMVGFIDMPRSHPFTLKELRTGVSGTRNGLGNVYRVPSTVLDTPE